NGVDQGDYTLWMNNYGIMESGSTAVEAAVVPEPASALLWVLASVAECLRYCRAGKRVPITR
ncbi:MAG: hypothetical protein ACR2NU_17025, partial [Aeoliella sp.]